MTAGLIALKPVTMYILLQPRHPRPRDTALVVCAGTSRFQAGIDGVLCAERYGAVVPQSTCSGIQSHWSSSTVVFTLQLLVPPYRLSIVGRRSFPVAASTFWNTLPDDIQSAPSVSAFRRLLKTFLFQHSFPDVIL